MESINLNNLKREKTKMLQRKAHATFFQEHSLPKHQHKTFEADFRSVKRKSAYRDLTLMSSPTSLREWEPSFAPRGA